MISDDCAYVTEFFSQEERTAIVNGSIGIDFAVMAQCFGGGVLSASSLSWWGAFYASQQNLDAIFVAPKYWAGHRIKKWIPESILTSWITYVE